MYDWGNVIARNNGGKHRPKAPSHSVRISNQGSVGLIPADECHAATPDFLGLWGFELTSQAFVLNMSLTLPSPYPQHLRIL